MTKLFITAAAILYPAVVLAGGMQPAGVEVERRAELKQLLDGVKARLATVPSQRECAPLVDFTGFMLVLEEDISRTPLSAEAANRIEWGIGQLDDFAQYFGLAVGDVCQLYDRSEASAAGLADRRIDVENRLTEAVTAIQARMPANPSELEAVFPAGYCSYPPEHVGGSIRTCLHEGTPFEALQAFVHVAPDGVIRARRANVGLGSARKTENYPWTGGSFLYRNHTKFAIEITVRRGGSQFRFGAFAKRARLHEERNMLDWTMRTLQRERNLPASATLADVYVRDMVDAARRHAASWCQTTVKSGALTARVFNSYSPDRGSAVMPYSDASKVLRADIENLAATGVAELCNGNNADLRALIGPALDEAFAEPIDTDGALYEEARLQEQLVLDEHWRRLRAAYLLGGAAALGTSPR